MMNAKVLALISVRVLGLFLIGQGILALRNLYVLINIPADYVITPMLYSIHTAAIFAPLALGLAVIIFSKSLARWVCPTHMESEGENVPRLPEIQSVAFSVLGLLIVFLSIPDLINSLISIYQSNAVNERQASYISNPVFLSPLLSTVFGILLFVGAGYWVRLYRKFREFGLNEK